MKVLKSLAVLALVFTLGACETKPKDEPVDPAPFLAAVKGKTIKITSDVNGMKDTVFTASADGKEVSGGGLTATFQRANSDTAGVYLTAGKESVITITSAAGGTFVLDGKSDTFEFTTP